MQFDNITKKLCQMPECSIVTRWANPAKNITEMKKLEIKFTICRRDLALSAVKQISPVISARDDDLIVTEMVSCQHLQSLQPCFLGCKHYLLYRSFSVVLENRQCASFTRFQLHYCAVVVCSGKLQTFLLGRQ